MIPGLDQTSVLVLSWTVAALLIGWTWVPALIAALGGTRYACGGSNDTSGMAPGPNQPDYSFWAEQLLALGYEPLGSGWMRINFAGHEWTQQSIVRVFCNSAKNSFAFMQRAPTPLNFWPGATFATCLNDGGILTTGNNSSSQPHPEDEHVRQGTVTLKLEDVEALHLATQQVLAKMSRKPDPDMSLDALLRAAERHFGPEARRVDGRAGTQYLFTHGLIHICVSLPSAHLMGIGSPYVALANIVIAVVMLCSDSAQKRQFANAARAALRERLAMSAHKRTEL